MPFFPSAAMASSQLSPPFRVEHQLKLDLHKDLGSSRPAHHLPGYPHIALDDRHRIWGFLDEEFCSDDLDKMADRLWWMTKQDSASISPLHRRQRVKRRAVRYESDFLHRARTQPAAPTK
ncbi:Uu.00g020770.m01.CDS01 [Anthostomella pinea]|uniref:Uu.00g020770.m01.CDS01 n=1 Tax=Anthostomella pinea TaxID=933095 RepID=A0AAI8VZJ8_9PEZI|nr:Uu.00g020770.m01.CDS01 [Anthostomella pinea]